MKYKEPYRQESSIIYEVFQACKKGISEEDIIKLVNKRDGSPVRILRDIKKGYGNGFQWNVDDSGGWLKISHIRPAVKL